MESRGIGLRGEKKVVIPSAARNLLFSWIETKADSSLRSE
jgi:hypothetical protein